MLEIIGAILLGLLGIICGLFLLWFVGSAVLAWLWLEIMPPSSHSLFLIVVLATLIAPMGAEAQSPSTLPPLKATGSIFTAQCDWAYHAQLTNVVDGKETWLDPNALATMHYIPGVWHGYESPTPWGGSYPEVLDGWLIELYSPCGVLPGNVWRNLDGSILIILVTELRLTDVNANPCSLGDGSERCGYHQNVHGYVSAEEWARVSGLATGTKSR